MKPLGRKPVRFPCKVDVHPKRGDVNWWESELGNDENVSAHRQAERKAIDAGLDEYEQEQHDTAQHRAG